MQRELNLSSIKVQLDCNEVPSQNRLPSRRGAQEMGKARNPF